MAESISKSARVAKYRTHEISVIDDFKHGYRNREDITNTQPGILVVGSQNVLVNTASRVQVREGYVVDGATSIVNAPIKTSFQWNTRGNGTRFVRAGFLTTAGNDGKLQFRYSSGTTVTWTDLLSSLTTVSYNYTTFWDTTELLRLMLFVNGTSNIFEWNGAYDTVASVTAATIVMNNAIGSSGFYSTRNRTITINGIDYAYTGISNKTFTGVSPSPVGVVNAGDLAFQKVVTTANSAFTQGPSSTFANDLISTLNNQVFIASLTSPTLYMSKINSFIDYSFSATRTPGEGATATLDDNVVGFIQQEENMYITAGTDFWYNTTLTQSTVYNGSLALVAETFKVQLLKVDAQRAAQSQALVSKAGNKIIMVTNEPTFDELGRVEDIIAAPNLVNLSEPIKLDFDTYDFTGGSVYSWRNYRLVTIPTLGLVRIYNEFTRAWEAPQTLPITSFYTVDGDLYGHSSVTSESYHLFSGNSDRVTSTSTGQPIQAIFAFSYQNFGLATVLKNGNEFYIEGYINANTTLNCMINYELDGCMTTQTFTVDGSDKTIVCIPSDESSLGKVSLGKEKLGGDLSSSLTGLPPKVRVIKTTTRVNFYESQFMFTIFGKDQRFELLRFGSNFTPADDTNFAIKQ